MITSYLGTAGLRKLIAKYNRPNLLHLIGLALRALGLQIEYLLHARPHEYVVIAFDAFLKTESRQQAAHGRKRNVRIRCSAQNLVEGLVNPAHGADRIYPKRKSATKTKKAGPILSDRPLNLILAVTYVPASFPAQYHRPGKA
jgi:hypothetical protein